MTFLRDGLIAAALIYVAIVAAMYLAQRSLMYFPGNRGLTPNALGLSGVTINQAKTDDGETILLWYAPAEAGKPMILYFQGNGGEVGDREPRMRFYRQHGLGICFVSYRGYGGSSGAPTESGLMLDANAAYDWLVAQGVEPGRIVLVGESLGTGVAIQLAANHRVAAMALEAPYTSAADVAAGVYWWLPVHVLMKDQFRSIDHIAKVKVPLLVTHGDADQVIPVEFGKRLFDAAPGPKEIHIVPGGTHDSIHEQSTWSREVAFFDRVNRP
jgi:hypothetical protein